MNKSLHPSCLSVFTIGHSNHTLEKFMGLLKLHEIHALVDVRSQPYSRYSRHFNHEALKTEVRRARMEYVFLGCELGGRPDGEEFYDADGHVLYARLAESPLFLEGIKKLEEILQTSRTAILCSEENPLKCHRHLLISRVLSARGVSVMHIRGDGKLENCSARPDLCSFDY